MSDPTLNAFIRDALAAGQSRAAIAAALAVAGWDRDRIDAALSAYADVDFPVPVPRPRRSGSAREAFMYIVFFALLGAVAGNVIALAHGWIDASFADPLRTEGVDYFARSLRWPTATLLVGYPIFLLIGWRLAARRRADPERRASSVRAWLTYVTLIFAALVLIGDLVAVVYQFLNGELSQRFVLKALSVGLMSGGILVAFTRDAERQSASVDWVGRSLAALLSLAVIVLLIWSFTVVRSPGEARALAFDERRIDDIETLANLVDCHGAYETSLPADILSLEAVLAERAATGSVRTGCEKSAPTDPATGAAYVYRAVDAHRFQLCATFDRAWPEIADDDRRRTFGGRSYPRQEATRVIELPRNPGETCFTFTAIIGEAAPVD